MKKGTVLGMLALSLILAGCGNNSSKSSASTSTSRTSAVKSDKKSSTTASSKVSSTSSNSSSNEATSSSTSYSSSTSVSQKTNVQRLAQFNATLKSNMGTGIILPNNPGYSNENQKVNVWYEGNAANFTIYYSSDSNGQEFNATNLKNVTSYATFTKKTYATASQAQSAVNYRTIDTNNGLPTVNLGYGLTGTIDSGAGQKYLQWNEGRWSFTVHATAVNNEDPTATAKTVVSLLEEYYLPAPNTQGSGSFNVAVSNDQLNQTLTWQNNNVVYTIRANSIDTLIRMVATVK